MHKNLFVVDDFFKDPDKIRQLALSQDFYDPLKEAGGYFAGLEAVTPSALVHQIMKRVPDIVNHDIQFNPSLMRFRALTRQKEAQTKTTGLIHDDNIDFALIICLNKSTPIKTGVHLYQHRPTGLLGWHDEASLQKTLKMFDGDFTKMANSITRDQHNPKKWEIMASAYYSFNRLIIINGRLFHALAPGFGHHPGNAKLTMNIFFRKFKKRVLPDHKTLLKKS